MPRRGLLLLASCGLVLGGCAAARVSFDCDGGACGQVDAACSGDACVVCPEPAACNAEALCSEAFCGGLSFVCSLDGPGHYGWTTTMANCDDGDPCTDSDHCTGMSCAGTPRACATPPPAECVGTGTLRTYTLPGQCVDGTCEYSHTDRTCPSNDCQSGTCSGDPCAGVTCTTPGDPCRETVGTCVDGDCEYPPKVLDCDRPHATGGHCVAGACAGWTCDSGYANCNGSWDDGCEASLKTSQNCGSCGTPCTAGTHATASCATGSCVRGCTAPWQNCDGDWANGCEIPVGRAISCDATGLKEPASETGCGTPYCGTSASGSAHNFGTWYCIACSTCHHFTDGSGYSWCLQPGIQWSTDRCPSCCATADLDKVCGP
jgi:hypothetical protein